MFITHKNAILIQKQAYRDAYFKPDMTPKEIYDSYVETVNVNMYYHIIDISDDELKEIIDEGLGEYDSALKKMVELEYKKLNPDFQRSELIENVVEQLLIDYVIDHMPFKCEKIVENNFEKVLDSL